ncbi:hypothetical protein Tco_1401175 [Tanacetum coccineum]
MNLYLCTEGPAAAQLFERNAVVLVPIDKGRMPGRRSSTIPSNLNPKLKGGPKLGARRKRKSLGIKDNGIAVKKEPGIQISMNIHS